MKVYFQRLSFWQLCASICLGMFARYGGHSKGPSLLIVDNFKDYVEAIPEAEECRAAVF